MTRLSDHTFTSSAPVFGADDDSFDPFFDTADRAATRAGQERESPAVSPFRRAPATINERSH